VLACSEHVSAPAGGEDLGVLVDDDARMRGLGQGTGVEDLCAGSAVYLAVVDLSPHEYFEGRPAAWPQALE
jgi:hypothetical protein